MKNSRLVLGLIVVMMSGCLSTKPTVSDPKMNAFIGDLMSRMTVEEKIGQLNLLSTRSRDQSKEIAVARDAGAPPGAS